MYITGECLTFSKHHSQTVYVLSCIQLQKTNSLNFSEHGDHQAIHIAVTLNLHYFIAAGELPALLQSALLSVCMAALSSESSV